MQLINTKISYYIGEKQIICNEINSQDYTLEIDNQENHFKVNVIPKTSLFNFKINFYIKINSLCEKFLINGFQTWSRAEEIVKNQKKTSKNKIYNWFLKGTGWDYTGEYTNDNSNKNDEESFGLCYLTHKKSDKIFLFASLNEQHAYTKFTFDWTDNILTITRNYYGTALNKNEEICNIIYIEDNYKKAFLHLKDALKLNTLQNVNKKLIAYNTYTELGEKIDENSILKIANNLPKEYNAFIIGDGYTSAPCEWNNICNYKFPNGFNKIIKVLKNSNIKVGLWLSPFAISKQSPLLKKKAEIVLTDKKNMPIITCPYWNGVYSLDITNNTAVDYLKNLLKFLTTQFDFDFIFCDNIYMAGAIAKNGKTQATLINQAISLLKTFANGTPLVLGGAPFLSLVGKCDYISISPEGSKHWIAKSDNLSRQFHNGALKNIQSFKIKRYCSILSPCIYQMPPCKKISKTLAQSIFLNADNIVLPSIFLK